MSQILAVPRHCRFIFFIDSLELLPILEPRRLKFIGLWEGWLWEGPILVVSLQHVIQGRHVLFPPLELTGQIL